MRWIRALARSRALRLTGTAVGLILLVHGINLGQAAAVLGHADARLELLGVALTGLGLACAVGAWGVVTRATGASVGFHRMASWYLQGIFVGHVTPSGAGGDATRAAGVSGAIGHGRGLASVAATRMAGGLSMAMLGFAGAVIAKVDFGVPIIIAAGVYLAVMLSTWWLALGAHRVTRALHASERRLILAAAHAITPITEALARFRQTPGALLRCVGLASAGWLLNIFALQTFAAAVGVHQPPSIFAVAVPISLIATLAPVAINGIGLREGVLIGLLVHLGESPARAGALALLVDLQLVPFALIGATLFFRAHRRNSTRLSQTAAV